jgi:hypothetical protein
MAYGGPPAMPGGNPSMFAGGGPNAPGAAAHMRPGAPGGPSDKVMVDLGLEYDPSTPGGDLTGPPADPAHHNATPAREVADC